LRKGIRIFVRGAPGSGKTTLIKRIVEDIPYRVAGFYTEEVRSGRSRVGFKVVSFDDGEGILAHLGSKSSHRVGRYGVAIEEFERVALPALEKSSALLIIDELGRMEFCSARFRQKIFELFARDELQILATIPICRLEPVEALIFDYNPIILELSISNRQAVLDRIRSLIL
jgi:nucleoside-triphosphatase